MNNNYEEEVYKFFTETQNFETMVKVLEHSDKVLKKIPEMFWNKLKDQLTEELNGTDWIVSYSDAWEYRYNKLMIYKKSWKLAHLPIVGIAFENIHYKEPTYYGVFVDIQSEYYNGQLLRDAVRKLKQLCVFKQDGNPWWSKWEHSAIDTSSSKGLRELLLDKQKLSIENAKQELLNLKQLIEPEIDILIENHKNKHSELG